MRTSFLSRSVIAVASLAIGSVALVATPATAATPSGVTREMVLTAARGLYAHEGVQHSPPDDVVGSFDRLVELTCDVDLDPDGPYQYMPSYVPVVTGNADGILITVELDESLLVDENSARYCTFAALATADESFDLSGNISVAITGDNPPPPQRPSSAAISATAGTALSGKVFVTEPIKVDHWYENRSASLTMTGNATRTINVTTPGGVKTKKARTAAGEKASKAKYDKRLKAAAKWYAKKLQKAGSSKTKRAAAKMAYNKKKDVYKLAYEKHYFAFTAGSTTSQIENRPFDVTVSVETRYDD
jgi:hypothetical protein